MTIGLHSGSPTPPGPPAGSQNYAIVGGTGAFFGVRGQKGQRNALLPGAIGERTASITEDPAKRRQNGGGHVLAVLYVIPMSRPEIATISSGPAVFHSDFTPVTAAKPARAGEVLIVQATGLGPTVPGVDFGQPFPTGVFQQVNSPVDVTLNGKPADVNQQNRLARAGGHVSRGLPGPRWDRRRNCGYSTDRSLDRRNRGEYSDPVKIRISFCQT
jgi:uncharacterized protein (TIGR03437 family)